MTTAQLAKLSSLKDDYRTPFMLEPTIEGVSKDGIFCLHRCGSRPQWDIIDQSEKGTIHTVNSSNVYIIPLEQVGILTLSVEDEFFTSIDFGSRNLHMVTELTAQGTKAMSQHNFNLHFFSNIKVWKLKR